LRKKRTSACAGKVQDALRRRGPDRPREGQQVAVAEPGAGAQTHQKIADGQRGIGGQRLGPGIEPQDVAHHAQKARVHGVAALREQRVQVVQRIFEPAPPERDAEAHVAFRRGHAQPVEQGRQMRIGGVVEHDEPGIDRLIPALARDHGAGVTAKSRLGLVQHHRMVGRQQMRRPHSGYAATDHRDASRCGAKSFKGHEGLSCRAWCHGVIRGLAGSGSFRARPQGVARGAG
jgi:hypothetical protein